MLYEVITILDGAHPIEVSLLPQVGQAREKDDDEDERLHERQETQAPEDHGPRVEQSYNFV